MILKDFKEDKGLVVFDGYCNLCNGLVSVLIKIDKKKRLFFTNFSSDIFRELSEKIHYTSDSIIFYKDGNIRYQSEAVIGIAETLDYPWKALKIIKIIPFKWREALYKIIARHRYSIFGKRDTCSIPSTQHLDRFID